MAVLGSSTAGSAFAGNTVDHADHGHSVARWVGVTLSFVGFLAGGVLFPFAMVPAVIVGGVFQVRRGGRGPGAQTPPASAAPYVWGELKAKAAAERVTV